MALHFMTGMEQRTVRANGIRINAWMGGKGPPVVAAAWLSPDWANVAESRAQAARPVHGGMP